MKKPTDDNPKIIFGNPDRMFSPVRGESEKIRAHFLSEAALDNVAIYGRHPYALNDRDLAAELGVSKTLVTKMRSRLGVPHVKDRRVIAFVNLCSMVQKMHFETKALERRLRNATKTSAFLAFVIAVSVILNIVLL